MREDIAVTAPIETTEVVAGESAIADALGGGDAAAKDAIDAEQRRKEYAKHALIFITPLKTASLWINKNFAILVWN